MFAIFFRDDFVANFKEKVRSRVATHVKYHCGIFKVNHYVKIFAIRNLYIFKIRRHKIN